MFDPVELGTVPGSRSRRLNAGQRGRASWCGADHPVVAEGEHVQAAYAAGLIHRDVNPNNILLALTGDGKVEPKLVDFGLVREAVRVGPARTGSGPLGTPSYMSTCWPRWDRRAGTGVSWTGGSGGQ